MKQYLNLVNGDFFLNVPTRYINHDFRMCFCFIFFPGVLSKSKTKNLCLSMLNARNAMSGMTYII